VPVLVAALLAAGCSGSDDTADPADTVATTTSISTAETEAADAEPEDEPAPVTGPSITDGEVRASVERLILSGHPATTEIQIAADGQDPITATTDDRGNLVVRDVPSGDWEVSIAGHPDTVDVTIVAAADSVPDQAFYDGQTLNEGYQYIEMRDGTLLAANVFLPPGPGPFVTVVEYSGYSPAKPGNDFVDAVNALGVAAEGLCPATPVICNAPDQSGSLFAYATDFAVVAVNMRGTGCSGGTAGFFDLAQRLDGYDVIEAVAAQDWVKNNQVGMVGLSYPGITQLYVAAEQPPSLAAIAPFSVIDDMTRDVIAPGGIPNLGFATAWGDNLRASSAPYGQGWEQDLVDAGDTICEQNQATRSVATDGGLTTMGRYYEPAIAETYRASSFADQIEVPVLLAGAWQDGQIGPGGLGLAEDLVNSPFVKVVASNGSHADPWALETLVIWKDFLDIYVGGEQRPIPPLIAGFFPSLLDDALFKTTAPLPSRPLIEGTPEEQRAAFEAEPRITYLFERGGDGATPGAPIARHVHGSDEWLSANDETVTFHLGAGGTLTTEPATEADASTTFALDESLATVDLLPDIDNPTTSVLFEADPPYEWYLEADGDAAVFASAPLAGDLVWLGGAAANLWIRSSTEQADLSVTVSEIRPDGSEMYIQSGFLRAELRTPGPDASITDPDLQMLEADASPLPVGEWVEVSIPVELTGHIFRAGSQIRISFHSPGGDRPIWTFDVDPVPDGATVEIGHDPDRPSSFSFDIDRSVTGYPTDVPVCGTRGQPCRSS
ncbi:MAG: CocE/NonD family hydrolase, partial [Actinomycetota bacterium]